MGNRDWFTKYNRYCIMVGFVMADLKYCANCQLVAFLDVKECPECGCVCFIYFDMTPEWNSIEPYEVENE